MPGQLDSMLWESGGMKNYMWKRTWRWAQAGQILVCAAMTLAGSVLAPLAQGQDTSASRSVQSTAGTAPDPALQANALARVRKHFEAADTAQSGRISAAQARQAGWGFVAGHFKEIDTTQAGTVRLEDIVAFLRKNGASL
jgi:hypothetical protein